MYCNAFLLQEGLVTGDTGRLRKCEINSGHHVVNERCQFATTIRPNDLPVAPVLACSFHVAYKLFPKGVQQVAEGA
jgi:hypothetical protein